MLTLRRTLVAAVLLCSACREGEHTRRVTENIPGAAVPSAPETHLGRDVPAASVWPPPADAQRLDGGVVSKTILPGTGSVTPELNKHHVLGIAFTTYDQQGRVMEHVPLMVQAIDLARPAWRAVLLKMTNGEVRRAWITAPDGSTSIIDFEIRSFAAVRPDGTAVEIGGKGNSR